MGRPKTYLRKRSTGQTTSNPYVASAIDPQTGAYSIGQNVYDNRNVDDVMTDFAESRSQYIKTSIDHMRDTKVTHFSKNDVLKSIDADDHHLVLTNGELDLDKLERYFNGGKYGGDKGKAAREAYEASYTFRDGGNERQYMGDSVKNGAAGTHAEVLAASDVLRFKDDIGRCLKPGSNCPGAKSCLPSCSEAELRDIVKEYDVGVLKLL